jgi:Protein of unknown function (DUF3089)
MPVTCLISDRRRGTLPFAALVAALLSASLVAASCSSGASSSTSSAGGGSSTTSVVWLCQPGAPSDPCASSLAATSVPASGPRTPVTMPGSSVASKFDCFYVYPTVSQQQTKNSSLTVTNAEKGVAIDQAAPFSRVCNVWAPMYRSQTSSTVTRGLAGDESLLQSTFTVAYDSVLSSWQSFLAHDDNGLPIVLIGDSQGSAILIHLISTELDHQPSVLRRLLAAVIVGGNLQVPQGQTVGATFTKVPLCQSATQTGCAIAFSSFPSEPPADSLFGRPGQGVSLQSGQTAKQGQQIACVNPAALGGGTAVLDPYYLTVTQTGLKPSVPTPWVNYPDLYSASCEQGGGATWLQVTSLAGPTDHRPIVSETLGPTWGYHGDEFSLTLGNLLHDVAGEESAWQARQ